MKAAILNGQPAPAMKAVVLQRPTPGHSIRLSEVPLPKVRPGWVLIKVKAFGMNHSEKDTPSFGDQCSLYPKACYPWDRMCGRGCRPFWQRAETRSESRRPHGRHGQELQRKLRPVCAGSHKPCIFHKIQSALGKAGGHTRNIFHGLGIPFSGAETPAGRHLADQGATCALGHAAIQIAKALGCKVIATTHREDKLRLLSQADLALLDTGSLENIFPGKLPEPCKLAGHHKFPEPQN